MDTFDLNIEHRIWVYRDAHARFDKFGQTFLIVRFDVHIAFLELGILRKLFEFFELLKIINPTFANFFGH